MAENQSFSRYNTDQNVGTSKNSKESGTFITYFRSIDD